MYGFQILNFNAFLGVFDREYSLSLEKLTEGEERLLSAIDTAPSPMTLYCRHYFKQLSVWLWPENLKVNCAIYISILTWEKELVTSFISLQLEQVSFVFVLFYLFFVNEWQIRKLMWLTRKITGSARLLHRSISTRHKIVWTIY